MYMYIDFSFFLGEGRCKCKFDNFYDGMDMELFCTNIEVLGCYNDVVFNSPTLGSSLDSLTLS